MDPTEKVMPASVRVVTKLYNWGRVERHRADLDTDPMAAGSSLYPSTYEADPGGHRSERAHDFLPACALDHMDVSRLLRTYRADVLGQSPSRLEEEDGLTRLLYWRFGLRRDTDNFRDGQVETEIREARDNRKGARKVAQSYYGAAVAAFMTWMAEGMETFSEKAA